MTQEVTDEQVDRMHAIISLRVMQNRLAKAKANGGTTVGAILGNMSEEEMDEAFEQLQAESKMPSTRHDLPSNHAVFEGHQKLEDHDTLQPGDQTAVVSCLFSTQAYDGWHDVLPEWAEDIGKTIEEICSPDSPDVDAWERVFRRPVSSL